MSDITLILTDGGAAALAAAALPGGDPVTLVEMGLTAANFVAAPTLNALPGEFKRIAISGQGVDGARLHLTGEDAGPDAWTARGIGIYTDLGVLFAAYHHTDVPNDNILIVKASPATALIPVLLLIQAAQAALVTFENVNLVYPPASEAVSGVIRIATQARVDAAADAAGDEGLAVTAKTLRAKFSAFKTQVETILAAFSPDLAAYQTALNNALAAITGRTITGTGLASGGGDLTQNRQIAVTAASTAETEAMAIANKAVTPASLLTLVTNILAGTTALSNLIGARTITASGLATGGGNLSANRTIDVAKATENAVRAFTVENAAVTPDLLAFLFDLPANLAGQTTARIGPLYLKRVDVSVNANTSVPVAFDDPFPNLLFWAGVSGVQAGFSTDSNDPGTNASTWSKNGLTVHGANNSQVPACAVFAIGW